MESNTPLTGFDKVLVANRGEIARRVIRTLREMGIGSVAVYSDADADAPHVREADEAVRLGAAPSSESYLAIDRILAAARAVGADAVHPGYGFLAENPVFAERCQEQGLVFVGPSAAAIRRMGSKIEAKAIMQEAGVPVIPGFSAVGLNEHAIAERARELGYPILVKASAGGGGKGMRVVGEQAGLPGALDAARREAQGAFGDDALLIERYFEAPRHVELQIFGDTHGRVIHCFERECSIQRRHQKVIEEAPSPALDAALRSRMAAAAVAAAKAIGYTSAGTVEFVLDRSRAFYFLEVNTRLQVEHPVTEATTGLDLVRMQIEVAQGSPLALDQEEVALSGHAIEARLYAEDPASDFLPAAGRVALWSVPELPGLRVDSGVEAGSEVGVHYDPLLAKLIAHGATREEARHRLVRGLKQLALGGVATNRDFLVTVLEHPAFRAGELDTHFIERHLPAGSRGTERDRATTGLHALAAALFLHEERRAAGGPLPASIPSGWRNNRWRPQDHCFHLGEEAIEVRYIAQPDGRFAVEVGEPGEAGGRTPAQLRLLEAGGDGLVAEVDGVRRRFWIAREGDRLSVHGCDASSDLVCVPRFPPARGEQLAGGCVAPMTGVVRKVCVSEGDAVAEGTLLLVLEAMKMEHRLVAHAAGVVAQIRVEEGQMVDPDDVLIVVEPVPDE
jgi:acetyl-CoA carboxylase biotin carboxylase subunit